MAYETGIATNYLDLLAKLITFATANGWTLLRNNTVETTEKEVVLRGPGGGADNIYVGIRTLRYVAGDLYNWDLTGWTGWNDGAWNANIGGIPMDAYNATYKNYPGPPEILVWNNNIKYWLMVNNYRILMVCKVDTVYQEMYLGFITRYATPSQYSYPLLIAGTSFTRTGDLPLRYSDTSYRHQMYFTGTGVSTKHGHGRLITPDMSWSYNYNNTGSNPNSVAFVPTTYNSGNSLGKNIDDSGYTLIPIFLSNRYSSTLAKYGELDGIFYIPGYGQASENTVTIGSDTYLVVQDAFRTGVNNFHAVKLA